MATLSAAMVTLLTDNWAGAGDAPTFGALIDFQKDLADTTEQVIVRLPIHEDVDPQTDLYSNFTFTMQLRVKSTVSEDRLKVLTDETIRIINSYAITGVTRQFGKRGENTSDRRRKIYSYDVWATLEEHWSTGGTSYSSPGAGDVALPAALTVAGNTELTGDFSFDTGEHVDVILDEDNMASDDEDALATQQSIKAYADALSYVHADLTDTTLTGAYLEDLLMFGSANAAWVAMIPMGGFAAGKYHYTDGRLMNVDGADFSVTYIVPLPCLKGSLKLYLKSLTYGIGDADVGDYVTKVTLSGVATTIRTDIDNDTTDHTSTGVKTFAGAVFPAAVVDCSAYEHILIKMDCVVTDATDLDIYAPKMQCYYAT